MARLAEDQECQRHVLQQLIGRLDSHRQAYERRKRIDAVVREVAEMAQVALEFEGYMRQHLGPLQDLLDQVVQVDDALHSTVTEIEVITQRMLQQGGLLLPADLAPELTPFDTYILAFLTSGQLKKERLSEVWERLEHQHDCDIAIDMELALTAETSTGHPVLDALDNIQTLVDMRLTPLISSQHPGTSSQLPVLPSWLVHTPLPHRARGRALWRRLMTRVPPAGVPGLGAVSRLGLELVRIPAGTFTMGSTMFPDERPMHEVRISRPFYLGKYPVTQRQWEAVMGYNPSVFRGNPQQPVDNVSWKAVQEFLQRLNASEPGMPYRLPTEAEWEYAARAGSTTAYTFGTERSQLRTYAWYESNAGGITHVVRQRKPNAWGLYDMYGNIWEWTQDWYDDAYYAHSPYYDPPGPTAGSHRVVRGGSWNCDAGDCRSASRNIEAPGDHTNTIGFRLVGQIL